MRTLRTLLLGAVVAGTLDIAYAMLFWLLRAGVAPARILQSVAAGLVGADAFTGGARTALLGAALHYFISLAIVAAYWAAARRLRVLRARPVVCGAVYGLLVYGVMNFLVVPLSAARPPKFLLLWVACSIAVHVAFIGVPAALFARAAVSEAQSFSTTSPST